MGFFRKPLDFPPGGRCTILSKGKARPLIINEVEGLVGITKKNIRFYETEGLLAPRRNSDNGYREYNTADVETLQRIKLLRKLGVPISEIRALQSGRLTVADAMRRHQVTLERKEDNLQQARALCARLEGMAPGLDSLDASGLLEEMEQMEKEGTAFMDKQKHDTRRRRYIAPVVVTVGMAVLMGGLIWLFLWGIETDPAGAPPLPLLVLFILIPAAVVLGVVIALMQRIREIGEGEEDDARKY